MADNAQRLEEAIKLKQGGSYDEAVEILSEIVQEDQDNPEIHRQLGLVYGYQGLFDESLEELDKAVQLDDSRSDLLADLAMTHCMLGMYDEAKEEFERVLEMDPENKIAKQQLVYFGDMAAAG